LPLRGGLHLNGQDQVHGAQSVMFTRDAQSLMLAGQALAVPVALSRPFEMNRPDELRAADRELCAGTFCLGVLRGQADAGA